MRTLYNLYASCYNAVIGRYNRYVDRHNRVILDDPDGIETVNREVDEWNSDVDAGR